MRDILLGELRQQEAQVKFEPSPNQRFKEHVANLRHHARFNPTYSDNSVHWSEVTA
jgi:hypothetical protein